VGCVGWHVDGLSGLRHQVLASESQLHLTLEHGEHLLEVMTVRRRTTAGWNVHVNKCVLAGGVVARNQDRIGVPDEAKVRKAFVFVWSSDGEVSLRIVGRYRPSG
jgi:hypothetical protein